MRKTRSTKPQTRAVTEVKTKRARAPHPPETLRAGWNERTRARLLMLLRGGNYVTASCKAAGIAPKTFYEWRKRPEPEYVAFREACDRAIADSEEELVASIRNHGAVAWQAHAWLLERRAPQRWGKRERVEHSGPKGGPIELVDVEQRVASKLARLLAGTGSDPGVDDAGGNPGA